MKTFFEAKNSKELCKLLDLPESDAHKIELRTDLVVAIKKFIERNRLTHMQVAEKTGIGRTVITAVVNGNLKRISTDRLLDIAHGLGLRVHLKVA
jgi:predicted XRE-type DNA-binding protein